MAAFLLQRIGIDDLRAAAAEVFPLAPVPGRQVEDVEAEHLPAQPAPDIQGVARLEGTLLLGRLLEDDVAVEVIRQRPRLQQFEIRRPVEQRAVDAAHVRALVMHETVTGGGDLRSGGQVLQDTVVLHLGQAEDGVPAPVLLRHRLNDRSDVGKLLPVFFRRPVVLPFRQEGLVALAAVVFGVEEVLHVVEADHIGILRHPFGAGKQQERKRAEQQKVLLHKLQGANCSTTRPPRRDPAPRRSSGRRRAG